MLHLESGRHATRIDGGVTVGTAVGADITEIGGGGGKGRTLPPTGSSACGIVLVLHLAVPRRVIRILLEII